MAMTCTDVDHKSHNFTKTDTVTVTQLPRQSWQWHVDAKCDWHTQIQRPTQWHNYRFRNVIISKLWIQSAQVFIVYIWCYRQLSARDQPSLAILLGPCSNLYDAVCMCQECRANESSDVWLKIDSESSQQCRISNAIEHNYRVLLSFWHIKQTCILKPILRLYAQFTRWNKLKYVWFV